MINVLLIDDDRLTRFGIRAHLDDPEICIVGEADSGAKGIASVKCYQPDVILLDFSLPDMSGLEVARRCLQSFPHIKIIILTSLESTVLYHRLLTLPIGGLMKKQARVSLIETIKTVISGKRCVQEDILEKLAADEYLHPTTLLTHREYELLYWLSKDDLVDVAKRFNRSKRTLKNLRGAALKKMGIKNARAWKSRVELEC